MVKVGDNYEIHAETIDYSAWVWVDSTNPKTKETKRVLHFIGYYSSPYNCLEAIFNYEAHNCLENDFESVHDAAKELKKVFDEFKEYVKEIKEELKHE